LKLLEITKELLEITITGD